ncbi:MAG: tRNA (adenosine(37)-N6)-threonylcarbamoyltransferase complex dimerization subunit type 1 TsaB [Chloroflexota bacterium]|nr:tRNA (adenosine(37)-N6)-threonylcarbamoyltransferase complex dimerization subunit type 1 TsaB [Chloroflexota bacterium]
MYLAIDTSTDMASLALLQDDSILAELTWRCGRNHTTELLPQLMHLLSQAKLNIKAASGIIVARGPGSYNGLRVGVSTAKGLALSLGCPVVGVSTLEAAAYPYAATGLPVCAILGAGRSEIAAATYRQQRHRWHQLVDEHITTVDALCSQITSKTVFCGEISPLMAAELKERLKQKAIIPSAAARLRRAGFLAELGIKRLAAGDFDDPATLQPIYLRRPQITKAKHL